MSFFEKTNNQNKYYVYIILPRYDINTENSEIIELTPNVEDNSIINIKIIISKMIIPHNYSYIYDNYNTIVKKYKEEIHNTYILKYSFDFSLPVYPYNLFILNRINLHAYLDVCETIKNINKEGKTRQINFLCNSSYLKRTKEWGSTWKKNKFIIDKTNETMVINMYNRILSSLQEGNTKKTISDLEKSFPFEKESKDNENLFSIYKLSKYYFSINKDVNNKIYKCKLIDDEENYINSINKRPNYDYIDMCLEYFGNENCKIII